MPPPPPLVVHYKRDLDREGFSRDGACLAWSVRQGGEEINS